MLIEHSFAEAEAGRPRLRCEQKRIDPNEFEANSEWVFSSCRSRRGEKLD